jgi:hypothetical protein
VTGMRYCEPGGAKPRHRAIREEPVAPPAERYYGGDRSGARSAAGGSGGSSPRASKEPR